MSKHPFMCCWLVLWPSLAAYSPQPRPKPTLKPAKISSSFLRVDPAKV